MNCNNILKANIKYKCEMSNNREDQKFTKLKKWIFLESQSTMKMFCNTVLLNNTQKEYDHILLGKITGSEKVIQQGYLEGY